MKLIWWIFTLACLGVSHGLPRIRKEVEDKITVAVVPDSPTQVILISPEKAELLDNVKQVLEEMQKTTVVVPVSNEMDKTSTVIPEKTRRTRRPPKEKPKKDYPLITAYLDAKEKLSTAAPTPAAANPNFGTYITNIENLQIALTGMASDIDTMCDDNKSPSTLDPLKNPFIQFLQNITQQQSDLTNTVLQYWASAPGLTLQPLTLQAITLPPIKPLPTLQLVRSLTGSSIETSEVDEKLKGLEMAIKNTIEEILPRMRYIEEFPSDTASPGEWEKFNESIEFVAVRLRNKTIQQVLDKEKTKNLLENYEKYLRAVQLVRLHRDIEDGRDAGDGITARKGC